MLPPQIYHHQHQITIIIIIVVMSLKPLFSRLTLRPASLPLSASASLSRSSLRALSTAAPRQAEKPALTRS